MSFISNSTMQNKLMEAFQFRHACKVFDETRKIPENEFETLLESARLSPSSFGMEPWQLLVIQSPEKRELFREFSWGANGAFNDSKGQLATASHFIIFLAHTDATMKHHSSYQQTFMKQVKQLPDDVVEFINQAYQKFQERDFDITSRRQIIDWSSKQAYITLANMMNSAALLGIDSCPIEGFDKQKATDILAQHFAIDTESYVPAVMAAFGYRVDAPKHAKTRRDLSQIVQWF